MYAVKQQERRSRAAISIALLVILIGIVWALWSADKAPRELTGAERQLQDDLQQLWEWSDEQLEGGSSDASWTIRWNVSGDQGMMRMLEQHFFGDSQNKTAEKLLVNEERTVTGTLLHYGAALSISFVELSGSREQLMLLLTASGKELDRLSLLQAAGHVSEVLSLNEVDFTSSMQVNGYTLNEQAIRAITKQAKASAIDRYEDGGTVSETLYTEQLRSGIQLGGESEANLQIALHRETETGRFQLTIGIPVISGDYSTGTNAALQGSR